MTNVLPEEDKKANVMVMLSEPSGKLDAETLSPVLPVAVVEMAVSLLEAASSHGLTIAAAESCTGGLLASLLTDIEGASNAFERGFVVYSKQSKCDLLGLSRQLIEECGAVSEPVARAMAEGALRRSNADITIAITGFAGPGKPGDEPGQIHFAGCARGVETRHLERHFGDIGRGATRIACLHVALDMLAEMIAALVEERSRSHAC